jgi:hypothetical protein
VADDHAVMPTLLDCVRIAAIVPALYTLASGIAGSPLDAATGQTSGGSQFQRWRRSELCFAKDGSERFSQLLDRSVIDEMLKLAKVTADDHVFDLTFGNGLLAAVASIKYGARATVVPVCRLGVVQARTVAADQRVGGRVAVLNQDFLTVDLSTASVVTLHLVPSLNEALIPKFKRELRPGTRIVSWTFSLAGWEPDRVIIAQPGRRTLLLWTLR